MCISAPEGFAEHLCSDRPASSTAAVSDSAGPSTACHKWWLRRSPDYVSEGLEVQAVPRRKAELASMFHLHAVHR